MSFKLRDYQQKALNMVRSEIQSGHKRIIMCVPTGGGKSSITSSLVKMANAKGKKTLFMVHSKELVKQFADRLRNQMHVNSGVIMAGVTPSPQEMNQVASVQTLVRRAKPEADIVIIDETHRAKAGTYEKILVCYPDAIIIGLTATPFRTDGKGLGDIFTSIVQPIRVRELIKRGFLVEAKCYIPLESVNTDGIKMRAGDYDKKELANLFDDVSLVSGVVENYLKFAKGKKAIAFHVNVDISKQVHEAFLKAGVRSAHLDGESDRSKRAQIVRDFAAGHYDVLNNCALFREGFDVPDTECVIMNTATKSLGMYVQCVGRGLRPAEGKDHCIVIDHGNNTIEHGFVEDYDLAPFLLNPTKSKKGKIEKTKKCKMCFAVNPRFERVCVECGFPFQAEEREVKMGESVSFVVADRDAVVMAMVEKINPNKKQVPPHLLRIVQNYKGYKKGWVAHKAIEFGYVNVGFEHPAFWQILNKELTVAEQTAGTEHLRKLIVKHAA